jgi:NADH-quinone oxidoreductase subunit K
MIPTEPVLVLSLLLFCIGVITALTRRHLLGIGIGLQLMLASACLAFVGFNRAWATSAEAYGVPDGQVFALLAIAVAVAQGMLGLALGVEFVRKRGSADVEDADSMKW